MSEQDRPPLARLWEQSRNAVFAQLLAGVADFHSAEDLLQEVAVSAAENFHKYDYQRPFLAWALGIARNHLLMYYRRNKLERLVFNDQAVAQIAEALESMPPADGRREALRTCLQQLEDGRRRLIDMRYGSGMSIADMAAQLNRSPVSLKTALHRVRLKLETCIRLRLAREGRLR
jgi:RNA polymerase sigma-70 factor (ECF subfamily)